MKETEQESSDMSQTHVTPSRGAVLPPKNDLSGLQGDDRCREGNNVLDAIDESLMKVRGDKSPHREYANPVTPDQACGGDYVEKGAAQGSSARNHSVLSDERFSLTSSSSWGSVVSTERSCASTLDRTSDTTRRDLNELFSDMDVAAKGSINEKRFLRGGRGNNKVSSDDEDGIGKKIWKPRDDLEPILMNNDERFCLLPVKYHKAYEYYKMAQASYWTVEEVDLSQDKRDWEKLSDQEKHFISYVLAFFAASDGIVLENLAVRFMQGTFWLRDG
jgi:hypothetical protein